MLVSSDPLRCSDILLYDALSDSGGYGAQKRCQDRKPPARLLDGASLLGPVRSLVDELVDERSETPEKFDLVRAERDVLQ